MKKIFSNIFGVSIRSKGEIDEKGVVDVQELLSYDLVSNPAFSNSIIDFSDTNDLLKKIQDELKRQQLLTDRKEKINKLNNL